MINRYTRPEMSQLWSDHNRYNEWLNVEMAVLDTLVEDGILNLDDIEHIRSHAKINVARIEEIEDSVKHDVIAFNTSIAEQCGEAGRFFHYGLTSSDVVDTGLARLMVGATDSIYAQLELLMSAVQKRAQQYRYLTCIGRTHGMHAEPTVFGLKFLAFYAELKRHKKALRRARILISRGKLSGAVGVYGALSPSVEKRALKRLGLKPEPVSTQIIPRDRHASYMGVLATLASSMERFSVELRHLQRSEVSEVEEEFSQNQKGSSAMPHKKNPISSENLTGCARMIRGYALVALENVALWHERDISHSSAERILIPDATTLIHYMLHRMTKLVTGLVVNEDSVKKNLEKSQGVYFSGHVLLELVQKGLSREHAYKLIQGCAHKALKAQTPIVEVLWQEPLVKEKFTDKNELLAVFDLRLFTKHVEEIYRRVLGDSSKVSKG